MKKTAYGMFLAALIMSYVTVDAAWYSYADIHNGASAGIVFLAILLPNAVNTCIFLTERISREETYDICDR